MRIEDKPQLVILEGPQGSGKTSSVRYLASYGFRPVRGIPTGQELVSNREFRNWQAADTILKQHIVSGKPAVLDRCLFSLVAFNMRQKSDWVDLLYKLGATSFRRAVTGVNYLLIVLHSTPGECYQRKLGKKTAVGLNSILEYEQEVMTYQHLAQRLLSDQFRVDIVYNHSTKEELFCRLRGVIGFFP